MRGAWPELQRTASDVPDRTRAHDADLHPIGRGGGKELQPVRVLRRPARENRMIERHFIPHRLVGTYAKRRRVPKNLCWVHPGYGVTLASHEISSDMKGYFAIALFPSRRNASKMPSANRDPYRRADSSCGTSPAQRASSAAPYRQTERPRGVRLGQARAKPS
jgi:hypothetical protein